VNRDGPLVVLGMTGVTSALAILHRARSTARPIIDGVRES
jgi:hypothetical protein